MILSQMDGLLTPMDRRDRTSNKTTNGHTQLQTGGRVEKVVQLHIPQPSAWHFGLFGFCFLLHKTGIEGDGGDPPDL